MKKVWKNHIVEFIVLMLFLILYVCTDIIMAFLFGEIIDTANTSNLVGMQPVIIFTIALLVIHPIIYWIYNVLKKKFVYGMGKDVKVFTFTSIMGQDLQDFYKQDIGEKISILTNDITILERDYFENVVIIIRSILLFLLAIISIFKISYQMALFLIVFSLVSMLLPQLFGKNLETYKKNYSDSQSDYTARTNEYIYGYDTIKGFGILNKVVIFFKYNCENVFNKGVDYAKKFSLVQGFSIFLGGITFMGAFLFGGFLVSKGVLTIGAMIVCIQLSNHVTQPVYSTIEQLSSIKSVNKIIKKINGVIYKNEIIDSKHQNNKIDHNKFMDKILVKNLEFSYNEKPIIKSIEFTFKKNKKYALVGPSGSGKSTLIKLISGKLSPISGNISIDSIDINNLSQDSLLSLMSIIEQDVFLFKASLRDNVTLFKNYDDTEIERALIQSGLEHFIKDIDAENFITEQGTSLSGGERQRIAIARALIRKTPIILADEILSSLDNETANEVESQLLQLKGVTLISVTHRLLPENLKRYDEIIVLKEGEIIEYGSFEQLMNSQSYFKKYLNIQEYDKGNTVKEMSAYES